MNYRAEIKKDGSFPLGWDVNIYKDGQSYPYSTEYNFAFTLLGAKIWAWKKLRRLANPAPAPKVREYRLDGKRLVKL